RASPQPDAPPVDVTSSSKITARRHYVLILGRAARASMFGLAKRPPVADAAPVIHRQNYKTATRKVLIQRVRVVIIEAVVPSEQHLPYWSAVHEDYRRRLARDVSRFEELAMNPDSVGGLDDHRFGFDELVRRKTGGRKFSCEGLRVAPVDR